MPTEKTGWERENRTHFDEIVATYDRVRPTYPDDLFADILKYAGTGKKAIEIGAGTGIATAPMLAAGYDVTAVELGENMSEFLNERFAGNNSFRVITSTFEEAPVDGDDFDLVYAATAFHWVDAEIGCPKIMRLLKPGGAIALCRCHSVPADELYDEIQEEYEKYFYSHYTTAVRYRKKALAEYAEPAEIKEAFRLDSLENYGFREVIIKLYEAPKSYSADEYMDVIETYSDHAKLPESNRAALFAGIKDVINRNGGFITIDYVYQLYMGRKA